MRADDALDKAKQMSAAAEDAETEASREAEALHAAEQEAGALLFTPTPTQRGFPEAQVL